MQGGGSGGKVGKLVEVNKNNILSSNHPDCPPFLTPMRSRRGARGQGWGNHEAYGSIWSELLAEEARQLAALHAEGLDIRILHGATTEIAGARVIGATLWTDFKLYPRLEALARIVVPRLLNDYHAIRTAPGRLFTKSDMLVLHVEQKAAVFDDLAQPYPGPTVVMTHHLPVRQLRSDCGAAS